MSRLLCISLLFAIIGVTTCLVVPVEMPRPGESQRIRRQAENWGAIYPSSIYVYGGPYGSYTNGEFTIQDTFNDRPVYKGPGSSGEWSIYYRVSVIGSAPNKWVLDYNDVSEEWDGTVAFQDTLFGKSEV